MPKREILKQHLEVKQRLLVLLRRVKLKLHSLEKKTLRDQPKSQPHRWKYVKYPKKRIFSFFFTCI